MNAAAFSLRARLLAALLAVVAAIWAFAAYASYRQARHELNELLDAHLAQSASLFLTQASEEMHEFHEGHLHGIDGVQQRIALQIWRNKTNGVHTPNAPDQPFAPFQPGFHDSLIAGKQWRVYSARSKDGLWVQVGEWQSARNDISDAALNRLALPMLLALPLLAVGIWIATGRALTPLRRLADAVAARAPLDTAPIAALGAPRELLPVVDKLNALFARTAESIARERRFIGDASHELRTPIAAIRAQAQVAYGALDSAERQHALNNVIAGCDRMTRLATQLLTLSRLEAGLIEHNSTPAALRSIAQDVVDEMAPLTQARRAQIAIAIDPQLQVACDAALLHIVLRNLLENALHYGGDDVHIAIDAAKDGDRVRLSVSDNGPGIAEHQRADALQRFQRLDQASGNGAGLGLAIVSRIAEACGAQLRLETANDGQGLRVSLLMPPQ